MAALVGANVFGGLTVAVPNLPVWASWVLFGTSSVLLAKLLALYAARRSLRKLGATIATAAKPAWRS
jgi:hypothetical protein